MKSRSISRVDQIMGNTKGVSFVPKGKLKVLVIESMMRSSIL